MKLISREFFVLKSLTSLKRYCKATLKVFIKNYDNQKKILLTYVFFVQNPNFITLNVKMLKLKGCQFSF